MKDNPDFHQSAYAKINLSLEVLGRRQDGFHQIVTILQTIHLADDLAFQKSKNLSLQCVSLNDTIEENLVMRAASLLQRHSGYNYGAAIYLEKAIPVASGLGGGSSNAATTLMALSNMWGLNLSITELSSLAAQLGSDIPFFLHGGCALAEGRGEILTPLPPLPGWWAVVLSPTRKQGPGKTANLYSMLTQSEFSDGSYTLQLAQKIRAGTASIDDLTDGRNNFDPIADMAFSGLKEQRIKFLQAGAPFTRLTGTGPALYTLVRRMEDGDAILQTMKKHGYSGYLAKFSTRT